MKHMLRLVNYCKNIITSTQPTFLPWRFGLYQRPSSEEVCSIRFLVLATIAIRRGKKSVVRVAQRVGPLVLVQWLPSFFQNMSCLFDPSSTVWQYSFVIKFVNLYAFHICSCRWIHVCAVCCCRFTLLWAINSLLNSTLPPLCATPARQSSGALAVKAISVLVSSMRDFLRYAVTS